MIKEPAKFALLIFSVFLGAFANIVFAPHVHEQHYPEWGDAQWIGPAEPSSVAYYRKELLLGGNPVRAHVQISAPDGYNLYVNGTLMKGSGTPGGKTATAAMVSASASAIFDIAPYLTAGANVIAVQVTLQTRPARPLLILNGAWRDAAGTMHRIVTDGSWQVVTKQHWQAGMTINWYDSAFLSEGWPRAVEFKLPPDRPIELLDISPRLLTELPRGNWIWNRDRAAQKASFRRVFHLEGSRIQSAWIGVSSDAAYNLVINDFEIIGDTSAPTSGSSMDVHDIGRYLRWGENTVALGAAALRPHRAPRLATALLVDVDGKLMDFSSDHRWHSTTDHAGGEPGWTPAAVAGPMGVLPLAQEAAVRSPAQFGYPSLRMLNSPPPLAWWFERIFSGAAWAAGLLLVNLILVWITSRFLRRGARGGMPEAWQLWSHGSVAGTLLLCFLFLLQYDVRIAQSTVFQPAVFFAAWCFTLLWAGLALLAELTRGDRRGALRAEGSNG